MIKETTKINLKTFAVVEWRFMTTPIYLCVFFNHSRARAINQEIKLTIADIPHSISIVFLGVVRWQQSLSLQFRYKRVCRNLSAGHSIYIAVNTA